MAVQYRHRTTGALCMQREFRRMGTQSANWITTRQTTVSLDGQGIRNKAGGNRFEASESIRTEESTHLKIRGKFFAPRQNSQQGSSQPRPALSYRCTQIASMFHSKTHDQHRRKPSEKRTTSITGSELNTRRQVSMTTLQIQPSEEPGDSGLRVRGSHHELLLDHQH